MSNLVFPSEIWTGVSGTNQWGFRLPIKKTPSFKSIIETPANNVGEIGISLTQFPIWMYELDLAFMRGDLSPSQLNTAFQQIIGFFGQVRGSADTWLYFDPSDNGSTSLVANSGLTVASGALQFNPIGFGDGHSATFLLTRTVGGMVDLIQNFVAGYPLMYVGGSPVSPSDYSIDAYGNVTFNVAPANLATVGWFGQFFFRSRFDDDKWGALQSIMNKLWQNESLKFHSVLR